jgi:hypothetical protein
MKPVDSHYDRGTGGGQVNMGLSLQAMREFLMEDDRLVVGFAEQVSAYVRPPFPKIVTANVTEVSIQFA